jgi:hypothetical protein
MTLKYINPGTGLQGSGAEDWERVHASRFRNV